MRYLVNISYCGTDFYGFQKQPNKRTVAGVIEEALSKILNEKTKITGSSRTDKGVHASTFYFHFDTPKELDIKKIIKSLNDLTDRDIYIKKIHKVAENFHARYSVKTKEYKYIINTGEYNPIKRNLELEYCKKVNTRLIKKAALKLVGTHNFKSFTSDSEKENCVRTINYIKIKKNKELIEIYINANGFLKYMVRNIVGLLLDINEGKKKIEDIKSIIESEDRKTLGIKANSEGLYLNKINY